MTSGPISNRRIHSATQTEVTFWYRDHRDGAKKLMRLTPDEFLSRWFEHIPPRGLRMIRRSGLYANSCAKKRAEIQRQLLASTTNHSATEWDTKSLAAVFPLEPERCPVCHTAVICRDTTMILSPHLFLRKWIIPLNQPHRKKRFNDKNRDNLQITQTWFPKILRKVFLVDAANHGFAHSETPGHILDCHHLP